MRTALRALGAVCVAGFGVLAYLYLTLPDVRPLAKENPATTAFMELREREAAAAGRKLRRDYRWVPYSRISQQLKRAVLVAEDDAFWQHEGIDLVQIQKAVEKAETLSAMRGASTITQQLAKNLYLSPSRDPLRKLRELIITRRLEAALPKVRILELYLNVIEWGDGVWGAEAAARRYFGVPASQLDATQSALLAGAIINPRVYSPAKPNTRLRNRQRLILGRMGDVVPPSPVPVLVAEPDPAAADPGVMEELPASVEPPIEPEIPADPASPPTPDTPAAPPSSAEPPSSEQF